MEDESWFDGKRGEKERLGERRMLTGRDKNGNFDNDFLFEEYVNK